jgi:hypothetical protein
MEAEKGSATLCTHFNSEFDKDKLWKSLVEWNTSTAQCYKNDVNPTKSKNQSLMINLFNYELVCGKYTDSKCILKLLASNPDYCLVLNPAESYIW